MLFCNDKGSLSQMLIKELNDKYFEVTVLNDEVNKSDINKSLELLLVDVKKSKENNLRALSSNQENIIKEAILCKIPILFLNVDNTEYLKEITGVGIKGEWILLKPYDFYNVIDAADEGNKPVYESKTLISCNDEEFEADNIKRNYQFYDNMSLKKYVKNAAARISYAVNEEFVPPADANDMPALPVSQYNLNYIRMVKDYGLTNTQLAHAEIIMEVALFASFNPSWKYLRIRSLGAGLHPASGKNIDCDGAYARGAFQSAIELTMQPNSTQLITLSSEPKNINKTTEYTTSSSFSVGVDISKNPGFQPSYTISDSETRSISDFNIYNDSSGYIGKWRFIMSMIEDSIWDAFRHPFLKRPRVKELPILAKKNLQPVVETIWYTNNNFNGSVSMSLSWFIQYYFCDITSNDNPHYWSHSYTYTMTIDIDFKNVNS